MSTNGIDLGHVFKERVVDTVICLEGVHDRVLNLRNQLEDNVTNTTLLLLLKGKQKLCPAYFSNFIQI